VTFQPAAGAAKQMPDLSPSHLEQIVAVRDVRGNDELVSGVLVNLSDKVVRDVRLLVDRSWLWAHARHSSAAEDDPGQAAVHTVPGQIPPRGQLPFTYRGGRLLTQRPDGRFETSVSVVGFDQND
jgi:hypothetical protein